jgi:hypothetical protein
MDIITKQLGEDSAMTTKICAQVLLFAVLFFLVGSTVVCAAQPPDKPTVLRLEGGKMPPVTFSHATHVDQNKIDCAKCHHKDVQAPKACTTCHGREAKGKAPASKDAFHTVCQTCHNEAAAKGAKAPTKCTECHKK